MHGLTYGVIRVDSEEKLSVLTVQDVGLVMPGAIMCSVKPDGVPQLCRTDEIGELCVCAVATGTSYYGLSGMTKNTFEVFPMTSSGAPISEYPFIRTGLLGFVGPGGLVFVVGKMDGLMVVSGRRHNADDIVATALAVEPMKFVYRGRRLTVYIKLEFIAWPWCQQTPSPKPRLVGSICQKQNSFFWRALCTPATS